MATTIAAPPDIHATDAARLLAISDERDRWIALAEAIGRQMYAAGFADGQQAEKRRADAAWAAVPPHEIRWGPTHAQLEERRWGPGGRDRFADPRPGDYEPPAW